MAFEFNVPDMSCGHCVSAITQAVQQAAPGAQVTADLSSKRVSVQGAPSMEPVRAAIVDAGYEVQVIE